MCVQVRQLVASCPATLAEKPLELQRKVDFLKQVCVCSQSTAGLHTCRAPSCLCACAHTQLWQKEVGILVDCRLKLTCIGRLCVRCAARHAGLPDMLDGLCFPSVWWCAVLQELNMELPDLLAHPAFLGASLMQVNAYGLTRMQSAG